jgi:hypothetical protein
MAYNLISDVLPIQYKQEPLMKPTPAPPRQPVSRPKPMPPAPTPRQPIPEPTNELAFSAKMEALTGKPVPKLFATVERKLLDRVASSGEEFTSPSYEKHKPLIIVFVFVLALSLHLFVKKSIKHLVKSNDVNELFIIFMYAIIASIILWIATSHNKTTA